MGNTYVYILLIIYILHQRRPQILGLVDSMTGCKVWRQGMQISNKSRVRYRMHCYRGVSNHCEHANEIAINGSALQRAACHWEGTTYDADASGQVERGRNRHINKRQAGAGSLSTIIISTSSARTCNELHLLHMCFSINTRFVQAKYEHCV